MMKVRTMTLEECVSLSEKGKEYSDNIEIIQIVFGDGRLAITQDKDGLILYYNEGTLIFKPFSSNVVAVMSGGRGANR